MIRCGGFKVTAIFIYLLLDFLGKLIYTKLLPGSTFLKKRAINRNKE
jgi:hypothetical protein